MAETDLAHPFVGRPTRECCRECDIPTPAISCSMDATAYADGITGLHYVTHVGDYPGAVPSVSGGRTSMSRTIEEEKCEMSWSRNHK
jgi:hypothetical protein